MKHRVILSPSILAADKTRINEEISLAKLSGATWIHIDIMDGKFVPATTFDPEFVKTFSKRHYLFQDVHIMVEDPLRQIPIYAACEADLVTFHVESVRSFDEAKACIDLCHRYRMKAGISLKPGTPLEAIYPYLEGVEVVLVMSVEPGKGGQKFLPSSLDRISLLSRIRALKGLGFQIEVDGGINEETGRLCVEKGADILVAGSYLFGHEDFAERAERLLKL